MSLAFARLAVAGFLLYGFGYVVPLLRADLGLSESIAGLHASIIAVGIIASGVFGERLVRRVGADPAARLSTLGLALASLAVALAPHVSVTLAAALLLGACAGLLLSWVNQRLSAIGGQRAGVALARANLVALLAALAAPLAIAVMSDPGPGGRLGLLLPLLVVGIVEVTRRREGVEERDVAMAPAGNEAPATAALPAAYWRAWFVLVLVVGIEFSVVYWSSSLVGIQTGAGTAQATSAAAAFLVGMIVGRAGLAAGIGKRAPRVRVMTIALLAVVVGVWGAWSASTLELSAGSLFVAGLGVGPLYPIGVAFALSLATAAPAAAAARTTLASGVAILTAPFALAFIAERVGLVNAWPLVAAIAITAIGVLVVTAGPGADSGSASDEPGVAL